MPVRSAHSSLPFVLVIAAVGGCTQRTDVPPSRATEIPLGAAVSVFERIVPPIAHDNTYVNRLKVDGHDASGMVVAALLASGRNVVPASECTYDIQAPGGFHTASRKRAKFHHISNFVRYGQVAAEINAVSYVHGLDGSTYRFELERLDSQWRVATFQVTGVA